MIAPFRHRRGGDAAILARLAQRAWIAGRDGAISQTGATGGSFICPWTGATIAAGGICSAYVQVPGIGALRLFHAQGERTNLFLNSTAPATQDVSVGTGSVTISAIGSGYTLVTSAGTATATGYGAVAMGTPQVLTVSGAGTITLTVSGTPVGACVNVEQAAFAGIKIVTAGSTVTRTADRFNWVPPGNIAGATGSITAVFIPHQRDLTQAPTLATITAANNDGRCYIRRGGVSTLSMSRGDATGNAVSVAGQTEASGVIECYELQWDAEKVRAYIGGVFGGDTNLVTAPAAVVSPSIACDASVAGREIYGAVGLIYDPSPSAITRAALARALNGRIVQVLA